MGLGRHGGGVAVTRWLVRHGARVTVTDRKARPALAPSVAELAGLPIEWVLGLHRREDFIKTDLIVQNPGVPSDSPYLAEARRHRVRIENEAGLFFDLCPAPIIGITGSKGKSTTSTLIYRMLANANRPAVLAGNIRDTVMFEILDRVKERHTVVLELSSWHLEGLAPHRTSPHVAVITNVAPDHLNRYPNFLAYVKAKEHIVRFQSRRDWGIFNYDNVVARRVGGRTPGRRVWFSTRPLPDENAVYVADGAILARLSGRQHRVASVADVTLPGAHNLENVLAAVAVGIVVGVPAVSMRSTIKQFEGIRDRLETVRRVAGATYINDTTATNPQAVEAALDTFPAGRIVLIAGGVDKKLDYRVLAARIAARTRALVLLPGSASELLARALKQCTFTGPVYDAKSMAGAVRRAASLARPGDVVLLSPGGSSFNLFVNEFDRGEQFRAAVKRIR